MANKEKMALYAKICERAESMGISHGERINSIMDIESADTLFNMRLEEWLASDDANFAHDYCGINTHVDRSSFPATDFHGFLPRFAGN